MQNETNSDTMEVETFDDMNLKDEILRGIFSYGFETPKYKTPSKIEIRLPFIT